MDPTASLAVAAPATSDPAVSGLATGVAVFVVLVGAVVVLVGAVVLRRSVAVARRAGHLRRVGVGVRGVVVDTQIHSRGRGDTAATSFRPVVTFTTAAGHPVTTVAGPLTTASWLERTPVEVLHDPDEPEHAEVLAPVPGSRVDGSGVPSIVVGALVLVAGLAVALAALLGLLGVTG